MSRHTLLIASLYLLAGVVVAPAREFQAHVDYQTGNNPTSIAVGDFNQDGVADLVAANASDFPNGTVSVFLGIGNGTFQSRVDYSVGIGSSSVVVADVNGDGAPDLEVANACGSDPSCSSVGSISVLFGRGDGTFQSHVDYETGAGPFSVAAGDFNADGKVDLVTGNLYVDTVSVLLGNGDGTFLMHADYATGDGPFSVAVGDFNGDGVGDLVAGNAYEFPHGTVSILLGNGDGSFRARVNYVVGDSPDSVAVWDFDRDGTTDLVVANDQSNSVSVLLGNGDGTFQAHMDYGTARGPLSVAGGDFNGDGNPDLATANYAASSVSILWGNGDGTFQNHVDYRTGVEPYSVAVGDFSRDGAADLATSNSLVDTASVLLNTGGTFVTTTSSPNPSKLGQPVIFTTTVSASLQGVGTPTGSVIFKDGATRLGSAPLISGQASLTTSKLSAGKHKIKARYSGDSTFNQHYAAPIIQEVRP